MRTGFWSNTPFTSSPVTPTIISTVDRYSRRPGASLPNGLDTEWPRLWWKIIRALSWPANKCRFSQKYIQNAPAQTHLITR